MIKRKQLKVEDLSYVTCQHHKNFVKKHVGVCVFTCSMYRTGYCRTTQQIYKEAGYERARRKTGQKKIG